MTTMIKIGPLMLQANAEAIHDKQPLSVTTRRDTADRAYVSLMHMTGADFKQLALVANALDALEFAGLEPYRNGVLERVKKSADAHRALKVELDERTKERDALEHAYNQLSAIHNHREPRSEIDSNESLGLIDHKARI